jgi:hypothetical protein
MPTTPPEEYARRVAAARGFVAEAVAEVAAAARVAPLTHGSIEARRAMLLGLVVRYLDDARPDSDDMLGRVARGLLDGLTDAGVLPRPTNGSDR